MAKVLLVEETHAGMGSVNRALCRVGHDVRCCASGDEALGAFEENRFEAVITDLPMHGMSGIEIIRKLRESGTRVPVIVITDPGGVESAVEAMKNGAFDCVTEPLAAERIGHLVEMAVTQGGDGRNGPERAARGWVGGLVSEMVGESKVMRELREKVRRLARAHTTVLVMGETGTGKELVAKALHFYGPRVRAEFVCVNCPGLSAGVLESELFGHEKGAFTGAVRLRKGRFELADGGTILLDEVSEIDIGLQGKLLRVLQDGTFERVGSSETRVTGARVVATTNRNLEREVSEHRFRGDLYFRLNVVPVRVPPLRERKEDMPALVREFVRRHGTEGVSVSAGGLEKLKEHEWPGNVRELENVIERACVLVDRKVLNPEDLLIERTGTEDLHLNGIRSLADMEREVIALALKDFRGHQERAAACLGITSRTLRNKIKRYGLRDFRYRGDRAG